MGDPTDQVVIGPVLVRSVGGKGGGQSGHTDSVSSLLLLNERSSLVTGAVNLSPS